MRKVVTTYLDDLDGEPIPDGQVQELSFTVGRTLYRLDLRPANVEAFHEALAPFTRVAHRASRIDHRALIGRADKGRNETPTDPAQRQAIRAWAAAQGLDVPTRGRISAKLIDAYQQAHAADDAEQDVA